MNVAVCKEAASVGGTRGAGGKEGVAVCASTDTI